MLRQRRAAEVRAAVLVLAGLVVVHVYVVAHPRAVAHTHPGKAVAPRALHKPRAKQHRAVLHVYASERGHDLQQALLSRPKHLHRERPVGVLRHDQRGAAPICGRRARTQLDHLHRTAGVHKAQQHICRRVQPSAAERHALPRVGRRLRPIGRRPRQRHRSDRAHAHAVRSARAPSRLHADRAKHPSAQGHRHPHIPVGHIPQHPITSPKYVWARGSSRIKHRARTKPVLRVGPFHKARPRYQHLRAASIGSHRLHLHIRDGGQDLHRESSIREVGAHIAHLRIDHCIASDRIDRHVKERDALPNIDPEHVDYSGGDIAAGVDDLELGTRGTGVERHRDSDLLTRVGRRCGRNIRHARNGMYIARRPDAEVAHEGACKNIASAVGQDGRVDDQPVIAGRQDATQHDAQRLTPAACIQGHRNGYITGVAENAITAIP